MKKIILFLAITFSSWVSSANQAHAILTIDITRGHIDPLPIATPNFVGQSLEDKRVGKDIIRVLEADLERSGLFRPIDKRAFIDKITSTSTIPRFVNWRQINASALLTGSLTHTKEGKISVEFRLWDVFSENQIAGKSYTTSYKNWRRIAHLIADEIYKRLTGEDGYFDTRIVYVAESGPGDRRVKRLAIMDQDGANHKYLTDGRDLVLTPRFSPTTQKIIYLSYKNNLPRVYLRDIETGRQYILGDFPGMTFAPRFSPEGDRAIMSASVNGNSEIYELNLRTLTKKRLTKNEAIDTSPSYSPDGKRVVFNSDRGGSQQIYTMNRDGSGVKRITFGKGRYGTPVWSPRGDWIAFTKMYKGKFHIGVMRDDGTGERLLTESFLDEGPTWAPNGRVIMFTRQRRSTRTKAGASKLYSIDLTGYNERQAITPTDASDPAWSPLLK